MASEKPEPGIGQLFDLVFSVDNDDLVRWLSETHEVDEYTSRIVFAHVIERLGDLKNSARTCMN